MKNTRSYGLALSVFVTVIACILIAYSFTNRARLNSLNKIESVLIGAGDIGDCSSEWDEATARIVENTTGTVITIGDNVYENGTADEFAKCYEPSWGKFKDRTKPSAGNHDYNTPDAADYFSYFGTAAGNSEKGYYGYDKGGWHVVVINSNCEFIGGCGAGSPQAEWLKTDLASNTSACTLAYWHHPLFSSREGNLDMKNIWQELYEAGADVVINGHDHLYERFAPQDQNGVADPARGIREFIVGTGGRNLYEPKTKPKNSDVLNNQTFGVLKLTLHPKSYDFEFIPVRGMTFTDSGTGSCH